MDLADRVHHRRNSGIGVASLAARLGTDWAGTKMSTRAWATDAISFLYDCIARLKEGIVKHPPLVLVVEDNPDDAEILHRELKKFHCQPTFCTTGKVARDLMEQTKFDLVFLDLALPGMTGDDFLQQTKGLHPDTRFIVVSGHPGSETFSRAVRSGALLSFPKPISEATLSLFFARKQNERDAG